MILRWMNIKKENSKAWVGNEIEWERETERERKRECNKEIQKLKQGRSKVSIIIPRDKSGKRVDKI